MTQFNNRYNVKVRDEFDFCEHLTVGAVAYRAIYENDCCGTVGVYACCKECSEALDKQEDEEIVTCDDCGGEFARKDTHEWKPYDFYAPQGDEPMVICGTCRLAEKHLARVRKDRADYQAEFGDEDDDDDDDGYDEEVEQTNIDDDDCQLDPTYVEQTRGQAGEIDPELFKHPLNIPIVHPKTEPDAQAFFSDDSRAERLLKIIQDEEATGGDQINFYRPTEE